MTFLPGFRPFILILLSVISLNHGFGQETDTIYTVVDELPAFPGKPWKMKQFTGQYLFIPPILKDSLEQYPQRAVIVSFVVEKDGRLTGARIERNQHPLLDPQALQLIHKMPVWIPGKRNGQAVRTRIYFPCYFSSTTNPLIYDDLDAMQFHYFSDMFTLGVMYHRYALTGKMSKFLKGGYGFSYDYHIKSWSTVRCDLDLQLQVGTVAQPFVHDTTTVLSGTKLFSPSAGIIFSKRIFLFKDKNYAIEIAPHLSLGGMLGVPKKYDLTYYGAKIGSGVSVYWHPFKESRLHSLSLNIQMSYNQVLMQSPLQGGLFDYGVGIVAFEPKKNVPKK